jgi:hypothetical protein
MKNLIKNALPVLIGIVVGVFLSTIFFYGTKKEQIKTVTSSVLETKKEELHSDSVTETSSSVSSATHNNIVTDKKVTYPDGKIEHTVVYDNTVKESTRLKYGLGIESKELKSQDQRSESFSSKEQKVEHDFSLIKFGVGLSFLADQDRISLSQFGVSPEILIVPINTSFQYQYFMNGSMVFTIKHFM